MPVIVEIRDEGAGEDIFKKVFNYFIYVDEKFSIYKPDSEISKINRGEIQPENFTEDIKIVLKLSEETKKQTNGYFNIQQPDGSVDPSGLVKGWAIYNASHILDKEGFANYYIDAGGDVQVKRSREQEPWTVGIKNPFNEHEIVKVLHVFTEGVATSGTYIRGQHVYNPHNIGEELTEIVSLTVIGPNIYDADRFATAAFAMSREGVELIEKLPGFEAYSIDKNGHATYTSGFNKLIK